MTDHWLASGPLSVASDDPAAVERHFVIVPVALSMVPTLLKGGFVSPDFPEGALVTRAMYDCSTDQVLFRVEHPSFPLVRSGQVAEIRDFRIRRMPLSDLEEETRL